MSDLVHSVGPKGVPCPIPSFLRQFSFQKFLKMSIEIVEVSENTFQKPFRKMVHIFSSYPHSAETPLPQNMDNFAADS